MSKTISDMPQHVKRNVKPLNAKVPSYHQKLQFDVEFKKSEEREKIKPKEIFELKKNKPVKKKKY
jgi:hypothetical protein